MTIDGQTLEQHGLSRDEYSKICKTLGREPNLTELGIFSVMWSEHCSYKSSRIHLRKLPTSGSRVLQGPGENAGAVDVGDGVAAVFKIESHNHPSFIEPYQGAATGVGGIIRDIFTMGARPIALLNSLRFGPLDDPGNRRLMEGVVAGIGGYGNSIGIATVGGEVAFEDAYGGNPLVNVFCLGLARADAIIKGAASGVGNPVYYVGARTGRDGIHGATMASAEFDERLAEKRPAVQVGDPFMEKLLMEACLEVIERDALVGIQDMGAAGLTCSTSEMGSRGGSGIDIDVSLVPQRETEMTPYEIMLSESQERMLLVARQGREAEIEEVFQKWDLHAVRIGTVTDDGMLRVRERGTIVAEIPNRALTDDAPVYDRPVVQPAYLRDVQQLDLATLAPPPGGSEQALMNLLASPAIASKRWVYRQYDHMVRTNTIVMPGQGTGVVRVKDTLRALAMSVDGNGRYCYLDPHRGAMLAVAEAARNVACAGAIPIGATNCLNFGNPERPEIMWQFKRAVDGISEACRALNIPITGGNVSFYNETDGEAIYPTPIIGVVGLIEDARHAVAQSFQDSGLAVVLLGAGNASLGGSEYLKRLCGRVQGLPPAIDLAAERALSELLATVASRGMIMNAHDVSDGGIAVTLAECCFGTEGIGIDVDLAAVDAPGDWAQALTLFGEAAATVVVSTSESSAQELVRLARAAGVPARQIGRTIGDRLRIRVAGECAIDMTVRDAERCWANAIDRYFERRVA